MVFLELQQEPGVILDLRWGWPFITRVFSPMSGLLSSYDWHLSYLN